MPRISVLLPCRNAASYLPQCIASLQAQTSRDFEVIAIDDHSTDDTARLLEAWAAADPRVRITSISGAGLIDALNSGRAVAEGELIARMDADDLAMPARFELQLRAFEETPGLAACGTRVRYFPRAQVRDGALRYEEWLNSLSLPDELARDVFVECPIAHPALMIRADVLAQIGGYIDRGWPEDYDLVLRLFTAGLPMGNVPEVLLEWRDRPDRISRTDARYSEDAFRRCKIHYLQRWRPELTSVVVWGAGPVGKSFAKELRQHDIAVDAFVDIDPRKIGQTVHQAPVLPAAALQSGYTGVLILAAVSGPVARAQIRAALTASGRRELVDFVAVA